MRRHLAAAGTVALVSLSSLAVLSAPAAAAVCDRPAGYAARAGADLLKVGVLNLGPLGLQLPTVADLTVGSATSGMSATSAVKSSAAARYADARLLGVKLPTGPLEGRVFQQAPPTNPSAAQNNALSVDLGLVRAGTGDLTAHARWADGMACGKAEGPAGDADAALVDAALLPGNRGALVKARHNASAETKTATVRLNGRMASGALAEIGLADVELLGGAVGVKVLEPPRLKVLATGKAATSVVEYDAPLLEVTGPGIGKKTVSGVRRSIEFAVPAPSSGGLLGALDLDAVQERAEAEGLPLLGANPLGGLLNGLPLGNLTQLVQGLGGAGGGDSGLPALPELGGLGDLGSLLGRGGGNLGGPCELAVVKISIGELEKRVTDRGVTAQAASLRIQIFALGRPGGQRATVLDLGIGLLNAAATAPAWTSPSSSPSARPSTAPSTNPGNGGGGATPSPASGNDDDGCGGSGCSLPRTGTSIALIAGTGTLLFVAGRFLLLLTRRRSAGGPGDLLG